MCVCVGGGGDETIEIIHVAYSISILSQLPQSAKLARCTLLRAILQQSVNNNVVIDTTG